MMQELLNFYNEYKEKSNAYNLALNTLYFDTATIAPKKGSTYRNKMQSILSGEYFSHMVHPESLEKLEKLYEIAEDSTLKMELQLLLKDLELERHLPKDFYIEFSRAKAESQVAWHEAKAKSDFSIFKPHLKKVMEMQKEAIKYIPKDCSDYDYMLDRYESGMTQKKYDAFFHEIKTHLIPLIKEIQLKGRKIDDAIVHKNYDVNKQKEFIEIMKTFLQVDNERLYIGETEHPFTSSTCIDDVRIATHFYEDKPLFGVLATTHEYGHALYELQIDKIYEGTSIARNMGMGMHESQSRFLENYLGRSKAFWEVLYPAFKDLFKEHLENIDLDTFMDCVNISKPSLIRIQADELTYPLHILIRYEIEKAIVEGSVDYDTIDQLWNDKYEEYLGVRPSNDAEGILQDSHWSAASLGYFPTYALGSAYAAQFYYYMNKEFDVNEALRTNNFIKIAEWQKEHIHKYGASKKAEEILMEICHEPFSPHYYIEYLTKKFKKIYELD